MQQGTLPAGPVIEPGAAVVIDGQTRETTQVTVTRELTSGMPGGIIAGGSVMAATGSTTVTPPKVVAEGTRTPWGPVAGWPPLAGAPATVDLGRDGALWRQIDGVVDRSSGTLTSPSVQVQLVDKIDEFSRVVSLRPEWTHVSTRDVMVTLAAMCGYATGYTPSMSASTAVWAPLVSQPQAVIGTTTSRASGNSAIIATRAAWGLGMVTSDAPASWGAGTTTLGGPGSTVLLVVDVDTSPGGGTTTLTLGDPADPGNAPLILTVQPTIINVASTGARYSQTVTRTAATGTDWTRIAVQITTPSSGAPTIRAWMVDPRRGIPATWAPAVTFTLDTTPPLLAQASTAWGVTVSYSGSTPHLMGGLSVEATTLAPTAAALCALPRVHLGLDGDLYTLDVVPDVVKRPAVEVLQEISVATLTPLWIDELGVLHIGLDRAKDQTPVAMTASASLVDVGWTSDLSQYRRTTTVVVQEPKWNTSMPGTTQRTIWVAPDLILGPGKTWIGYAKAPDDQQWIGVETTVTVPDTTEAAQSTGTWLYGTRVSDGSDAKISALLVLVDARTVMVWLTNTNAFTVNNRLPANFPAPSYRGTPSPIIRASSIITWAEKRYTGATTGPASASDQEHTAGKWLQSHQQDLADSLSAVAAAPPPLIDSLSVVPDPRLQLGDRVRITDDAKTGIVLDGLVTRVETTVGAGTYAQSLGVRVDSVTTPGAVIDDLDDLHAGDQVTTWDAAWSGKTLNALDAAPLSK